MGMSEFEILAWNVAAGIGQARRLIKSNGYPDIPIEQSVSAVRAGYVTWLVAVEEASAQKRTGNLRASFSCDVIGIIDVDFLDADFQYLGVSPTTPLRRRLEALWGVRVAYTHSDGHLSGIDNRANRTFAEKSVELLQGVQINGDFLDVSNLNTNQALHAILEFRRMMGPPA